MNKQLGYEKDIAGVSRSKLGDGTDDVAVGHKREMSELTLVNTPEEKRSPRSSHEVSKRATFSRKVDCEASSENQVQNVGSKDSKEDGELDLKDMDRRLLELAVHGEVIPIQTNKDPLVQELLKKNNEEWKKTFDLNAAAHQEEIDKLKQSNQENRLCPEQLEILIRNTRIAKEISLIELQQAFDDLQEASQNTAKIGLQNTSLMDSKKKLQANLARKNKEL